MAPERVNLIIILSVLSVMLSGTEIDREHNPDHSELSSDFVSFFVSVASADLSVSEAFSDVVSLVDTAVSSPSAFTIIGVKTIPRTVMTARISANILENLFFLFHVLHHALLLF